MTTPSIPGPTGRIQSIKNVLDFQNDPIAYLMKHVHRYDSDIIRWEFGPQYDVYLLRNPDVVRQALVKKWAYIHKWDRQGNILRKVTGASLFASEGDSWMRQRRLVTPAFHTQRIKQYVNLMVRHTRSLLDTWDDNTVYDVKRNMVEVTMGIISEILFNIKDVEQDAEELSEALDVLLEMFILESTAMMPVPDWVPTPRNLRENSAMKTSREYVMRLIEERRADGNDYGDVMSALLQAVDADNGDTMTDEQVWAELMGLFIAGHETTAILMTWALYALAQQPELQDKLYEEVSQVMQGDTPTLDDLEAMTFTDQVIKETLRHYPPAWSLFVRELVTDTELGGHILPTGSLIFISPWVMHHDPRHWDNPDTFDPSRFEGDWKTELPSYSYMPFGGGPRVCLGAHMAEMEAEVMLATMVKHFTFELAEPDQQASFAPTLTLHPENGMPLRIRRRT